MLVSVSTHARTHVCMHLVRLSGFDISKGMVKLFGPTPPPNPIPFAWNLRFFASPNISSSHIDRAPRSISLYTPSLSIRSSYLSHLRAKEDVMFIFYDSSSATILRAIDKLKYHSARIIIRPYSLLQIYDDNIAGIVSPSQIYHRSDKHVSLL